MLMTMPRVCRALRLVTIAVLTACGSDGGAAGSPAGPAPASKTGTIDIAVHGLPAGASLDLELIGPNFTRHIVDSVTSIAGLQAGTYSLTANPVETPRYRFSPDTAIRQIIITRAGETVSPTVQYAPTSGQLAVAVAGLRADVAASIDVAGPNGFSQHLTSSDTVWRLASGTYTVTAGASLRGNVRYTADTLVRTVVVENGQTTQATVHFVPTVSLNVTVTGLPAGVLGDVDLNSTATARHATSSTTLSDIPLGTYTLAAHDVTVGTALYRAPAPQSVVLTEDGPFSLSIAYGELLGRLTLNISGISPQLGAPDGPILLVRGPAGDFTVNESKTLTGLPLGDYSIFAAQAIFGGNAIVYQAVGDIVTKTVRLDPTNPNATVTVPFNFTYGAIDVALSGLPSNLSAWFSISGPGGYSQLVEKDETFKLAPAGAYTPDLPMTVGTNPTFYRTDPLPKTFTLSAANPRAHLAVHFHEMVWSTVVITVPGLPPGIKMRLYMTTDLPLAPITLTHLYPEPTVISAPAPTVSGDTAAWVALNTGFQTFNLAEGVNNIAFPVRQTNVVNVSLGLGGVTLPSSTVVFIGPNNQKFFTGTDVQWADLPPGQYTVNASAFSNGSATWTPSVATQTVTVPAVGKLNVSIPYTRTP